jgi:hypothetical protein
MARIRPDWYLFAPPHERRGALGTPGSPVSGSPHRWRPPALVRRPGTPTRQRVGAMVAGSVLGLALLGVVVFAALAGSGGETVAGAQARRPGVLGAGAGGAGQASPATVATPATPAGSGPADARANAGTSPATGDPEIDRVLAQAEREGRLTPEQVAAISRAISGEPIFEDVRRLTDADVQRLVDATGLPPEELAPILSRLVATGRIAMPARPPQAVAGAAVRRDGAAAADEAPVGPPWK